MLDFSKILAVGTGGFIGAIGRFWLSGLAQRLGDRFPYGTLSVNILGSFILGLLATLFIEKMIVSQEMRLFLLVGLLGAFTTYSTFSLETLNLARDGEWMFAGLNILANVMGTLIAVWAGVSIAKLW
ncbi:MAG: fluoride efflux transporter CrcB [Candidatus Marinimicrobia bacterium]|jgi:CrcB protein|nr:fluoride efflux transporter CrcB [Candidatus Neomarinimicrobiota bacterium]MBT3576853.1 fluoride efflux transporter CrcB [Candidatus Neomarinimicrobiota bacterium]MBT3679061.1 fluoride efflux transporter CrcB [Candidatus Neomarinimicrobiota bacterium]MBT3950318.1 fluoride efflux transporter CrcB [Candidatus Neomarinimicrobiota bacterium]MBT4252068.1 fluoride efflux transporter CrcB [Candidatus Neomarinimicrobiota bacterium]